MIYPASSCQPSRFPPLWDTAQSGKRYATVFDREAQVAERRDPRCIMTELSNVHLSLAKEERDARL
jgi:hypothetical protein